MAYKVEKVLQDPVHPHKDHNFDNLPSRAGRRLRPCRILTLGPEVYKQNLL